MELQVSASLRHLSDLLVSQPSLSPIQPRLLYHLSIVILPIPTMCSPSRLINSRSALLVTHWPPSLSPRSILLNRRPPRTFPQSILSITRYPSPCSSLASLF